MKKQIPTGLPSTTSASREVPGHCVPSSRQLVAARVPEIGRVEQDLSVWLKLRGLLPPT